MERKDGKERRKGKTERKDGKERRKGKTERKYKGIKLYWNGKVTKRVPHHESTGPQRFQYS